MASGPAVSPVTLTGWGQLEPGIELLGPLVFIKAHINGKKTQYTPLHPGIPVP